MDTQVILIAVISLLAGLGIGAGVLHIQRVFQSEKKRNNAQKEAERIINRAKSKSSKIERESKLKAKDFENRARRNVENDIRKQKQRLTDQENS